LGNIQQDIDKLKDVKRQEGLFALGHGHPAKRIAAERAIADHMEKAQKIMRELESERAVLVGAHSIVMDEYSNAMAAQKELRGLKQNLGDLAEHVETEFRD
jgi:hypothetical protein